MRARNNRREKIEKIKEALKGIDYNKMKLSELDVWFHDSVKGFLINDRTGEKMEEKKFYERIERDGITLITFK